jgi:hypothetical protein
MEGAKDASTGGIGCWLDALIVVIVSFTAHYALAARFGLYQDDFHYVGQPMGWSPADATAALRSYFVQLPEGRPLGFALGHLVPFLCFRAGLGLLGVYLCGAAWVVGNALLARSLLAGLYGRTLGLLGSLAFTLFPGDTTHAVLTHALALQPALTCLLLALLCYTRGWALTSWVLAACALVTYETAALPFALAPLLRAPWDRGLFRRTACHALGMLALVTAVFALRLAAGEGRVDEVQGLWISIPGMTIRSVGTGAFMSLTSFTRRSAGGLSAMASSGAVLGGALVLTVLLATRLLREPRDINTRVGGRTAIAGIALAAISYCFTLPPHYPPTAIAGLNTSVHLAAALGAAMAWGTAFCLVLRSVRHPALRIAATILVSGFIATLWAFGVQIQQEMVRTVEKQRQIWRRVACMVPDLPAGGVVLALGREDRDVTEYVASSSWADTLVLPLLFIPQSNDPPVSFVRLDEGLGGLERAFVEKGERLRWSPDLPPEVAVDRSLALDPRTLLVLERTDSGWRRRADPVSIRGVTLPLQVPLGAGPRPLRAGPLQDLLLGRGKGDAACPLPGSAASDQH